MPSFKLALACVLVISATCVAEWKGPKCQFDCNSGCAKCAGKAVARDGLTQVVTVDVNDCKGHGVDWFCSHNEGATLIKCEGRYWLVGGNDCGGAKRAIYRIDAKETHLKIQMHDDSQKGNVKCTDETPCCGKGQEHFDHTSGCEDADSGVCNIDIDLKTCPGWGDEDEEL